MSKLFHAHSLTHNLCHQYPFLVFADYEDFVASQDKVTAVWKDQGQWTRMSILNTARTGKLSTVRVIREYCNMQAAPFELPINKRDL